MLMVVSLHFHCSLFNFAIFCYLLSVANKKIFTQVEVQILVFNVPKNWSTDLTSVTK